MKQIVLVYALAIMCLALIYLLFVWLFMRAARRRDTRRLEEAQEAIAGPAPEGHMR